MEGISVLNSRLPKSVKAATVVKNNNYCIILNDIYDEKSRQKVLKEELNKIYFLMKK